MPDTAKIRALNDQFRKTFIGGKVVVTRGISQRPDLPSILEKVRAFDQFTEDNDPHREHDFGNLEVEEEVLFFRIDYYSLDLDSGSPDPADEAVTARVLTIMLASEY
jgi:hypothetical protein